MQSLPQPAISFLLLWVILSDRDEPLCPVSASNFLEASYTYTTQFEGDKRQTSYVFIKFFNNNNLGHLRSGEG